MECVNYIIEYCYSFIIYFENCSPFGSVFIDFRHFSGYWISFKQKKRLFFSKTCPKILQKQLLANEIQICSSYIYCTLSATSKFNFESLFDFIKIFKEYLKQSDVSFLNRIMSNPKKISNNRSGTGSQLLNWILTIPCFQCDIPIWYSSTTHYYL